MDLATKDSDAKGMERRDFRFGGVTVPQFLPDPFLHLFCRLVGEGDGEDSARRDPALDQSSDPEGDDPRRPRSRPRQNEEWTG